MEHIQKPPVLVKIMDPVLTVENLEALLAKVTPKNRHRELFVDSPRGREVW